MNEQKTEKKVLVLVSSLIWLMLSQGMASALIVDHNCTDITQIPLSAIEQAKDTLRVGYCHASHGSQLTNGWGLGWEPLNDFANNGGLGLSLPQNTFVASHTMPVDGALNMCHNQYHFSSVQDLDYPEWFQATRDFLEGPDHGDDGINVIVWAWCNGAGIIRSTGDPATEEWIQEFYLDRMNQLEQEYPNVQFVYMTGHLDGTGEDGNLNQRNEQIRQYCRDNDKILYDFADIESYDPDGLVNYMELDATEECDYDSDANGSRESNWATDWQNAHTEGVDWYNCDARHTQPINANMKAYAAWWLWAKLSGWARVIYVDGVNGNDSQGTGSQGNPYKTVEKALQVASNGDRIIILAGTYPENITMNKQVTIQAQGGLVRIGQ